MLNIAIVGVGYWGPNLVRNFISLKNVNIGAVCDINAERLDFLKSRYPSLNTVSDYDDLIKNEKINAIVLATPIETHYDLAKKALLAGKHVFIEKPITLNSYKAEELKTISQKENLILMVGHTFLFSPAILKVSFYNHS